MNSESSESVYEMFVMSIMREGMSFRLVRIVKCNILR